MGNNTGGNLLTFLVGAIAGAFLGILYAPDKGKNTRDKLNFQLDKYSERLQDIIDDLMSGKMEVTSDANTEGEKVISEAIKEAEKLKHEVEALRSKIMPKKDEE